MRKLSKFKCFTKIYAMSCIFVIGCSAFSYSQGSLIRGQATDAHQQGVPGVRVFLYNEDGQVWQTETNNNGEYGFQNVTPGQYYIKFDPPRGWYVSSPDGGSYEFEVGKDDEVVIDVLLKGVVIDFGKPPATGGGTSGKASLDTGNSRTFSAMVRIRDIEHWKGETPYELVIEGEWSIIGEPETKVVLKDAQSQGAYLHGKVQFENLGENRFRLTYEIEGWPGVAFNGDLMLLKMVTTKGMENARLQVITTRITMGGKGRHQHLPNRSAIITQ